MGLLRGSMSVQRFTALGPIPQEVDLLAALAANQFRTFQDGLEEERMGWCDWRNILITPPDPNWLIQDRYAAFGLRIDTRRIPSATLKAHVQLKLDSLMKEKDLAFIGKEARVSLEDEVKVELLRKEQPRPKVFDVLWNLKRGQVITNATSGKGQGALISLFIKSFGVELLPESILVAGARIAPLIHSESLMALDPFDLSMEIA